SPERGWFSLEKPYRKSFGRKDVGSTRTVDIHLLKCATLIAGS
ncbi:conserved hypothetical protein, partial [delta proteobacterium NaphS2]